MSWVAPAEQEHNESISLSEIAGCKVYYDTVQGDYRISVVISDGNATGEREGQYSPKFKIVI